MDRFWDKVEKTETCWLWKAGKTREGIGVFQWRGRAQLAHRVAFELTTGISPDGRQFWKSCNRGACVNPEHLIGPPRRAPEFDYWEELNHARSGPVTVRRIEDGERGHAVLDG